MSKHDVCVQYEVMLYEKWSDSVMSCMHIDVGSLEIKINIVGQSSHAIIFAGHIFVWVRSTGIFFDGFHFEIDDKTVTLEAGFWARFDFFCTVSLIISWYLDSVVLTFVLNTSQSQSYVILIFNQKISLSNFFNNPTIVFRSSRITFRIVYDVMYGRIRNEYRHFYVKS